MALPLNSRLADTLDSPISEAFRWIEGVKFPADRPLINVSQAAPMLPPPLALRQAIADIVLNDDSAHLYGPDLGLPALRTEIASQWSSRYHGSIDADQVAITSGCNQAFTSVITTLAQNGDEVILPTPWYFNHKMHLDMHGITTVPLATDEQLLPSPELAQTLITERTRAIVLVTPNNPAGVEYPAPLMRAFYDLAKQHNIALIVDETYRDFDSRDGAPHDLFADPDWQDTLIQLYSFSKAYRLTGHRIGAVVSSAKRLRELEKYIDTVTICANQIGQRAALWGMKNLSEWLEMERQEILARRVVIENGFAKLEGWKLLGTGGFFAYVEHPFDMSSAELAPRFVHEIGVLMLPATFFKPDGDQSAKRQFRIAFANIDTDGINTLISRLQNLSL